MSKISDGRKELQRFIAAVEAVEKEALGSPDEHGLAVDEELERRGIRTHAKADRSLLARLRDSENSHILADVLEYIEGYRKNVDDEKHNDDDKRLIKAILIARSASENPKRLSEVYNQDVETHKKLERYVDRLHKFFSDEIYRDPESLILLSITESGFVDLPTEGPPADADALSDLRREWPTDYQRPPLTHGADRIDDSEQFVRSAYKQATRSLDWMQQIIKRRLDVLSRNEFRLSRKLKTAQKSIFMAALGEAMNEIFGQPLYEAVAKLTDLALETEEATEPYHARTARRDAMQRAADSLP
jgi:hypothetical protein